MKHSCVEVRPFPDGTSMAVCSCGFTAGPYQNSDLIDMEFRGHIERAGSTDQQQEGN